MMKIETYVEIVQDKADRAMTNTIEAGFIFLRENSELLKSTSVISNQVLVNKINICMSDLKEIVGESLRFIEDIDLDYIDEKEKNKDIIDSINKKENELIESMDEKEMIYLPLIKEVYSIMKEMFNF